MWFSVTLWAVLASLVCAYPSSRHSNGLPPDYDAAPLRPLSRYEEDYEGGKDTWTPAETGERRNMDGKESEALLSDMEGLSGAGVSKRESHSLSIVNPLDVLRQRLMLEMARRRMKENQDQIRENALILKNLGKRASTNLRRRHVSTNEDFDE